MNFIFNALFRKKSRQNRQDDKADEKLKPATAKNVLNFLTHGLTYGAVSLRDRYKPSTKINEFVAVSGQILTALKQHHDARPGSDSVVLSLHINGLPKQVTLTEVGQNVILVLDGSSSLIVQTTLADLYINLRNDVARHGEIYGSGLQATAQSYNASD